MQSTNQSQQRTNPFLTRVNTDRAKLDDYLGFSNNEEEEMPHQRHPPVKQTKPIAQAPPKASTVVLSFDTDGPSVESGMNPFQQRMLERQKQLQMKKEQRMAQTCDGGEEAKPTKTKEELA